MRKSRCIALFLVFSLLLCACVQPQKDTALQTTNAAAETQTTEASVAATTAPTLPDDTVAETEPAPPLHSDFSLPDYTAEQILEYFEEVALHVEYTDGTGADDHVKKWLTPIYYQLHGAPTDADIEVVNALCAQLNAIPGFPGIYPAPEEFMQNVSISFLEPAAFSASFSDVVHGEDAYGAAQFWFYTQTNELHTARIGCRTDLDQNTRNSVLQEEIINILGISDTILREDSITYQYSNENTALSDVDLVILMLLYHPAIQCGFDADSCAAIIRELYY